MDLLPKSHTEFSEKNYWEKFFKKWGPKAFEWYGEYPVLCEVLHKYVKPQDRILVAGCGNSSLSADMYDVGYKHIMNVDISDVVIKQMIEKNKHRTDMSFVKMDMMHMDFSEGDFSVVLDKGTLDALMPNDSEAVQENVVQMFEEIGRVLESGGRYVCVSLAQEHILNAVVTFFSQNSWLVRICRVNDAEAAEGHDFHMPVFVFVFTKLRVKMPKPILELAMFEQQKPTRYESCADLIGTVKQLQQYALVRQQLNNHAQDSQLAVQLYSSDQTVVPRYTLMVVDLPTAVKARHNPYAIFIVPQGRETEWLFASDDGRLELAKRAGFSRLIVVTLHREHHYTNLDDVKAELSTKVMELAPSGVKDKQVPFLSVGNDINSRHVRYRGNSEMSGEFVVEDVDVGEEMFRRLVFLASRNVIQSEAKIIKVRHRKKKKKSGVEQEVVDPGHLACSYQLVMVAGLVMLEDFHSKIEKNVDLLMLGLGGGGLPLYIHQYIPVVHTEVVEIDSAVVDVAKQWFNFKEDEKLRIHVADGLVFVKQLAEKKEQRDIIVLDVNGPEDVTTGMSCPAPIFLEEDFLQNVNQILHPKGVFMINMLCRKQELSDAALAKIKAVFPVVYTKKLAEEDNMVVFALHKLRKASIAELSDDHFPAELINSLKLLQDVTQKQQKSAASNKRDLLSLTDQLEGLKLF